MTPKTPNWCDCTNDGECYGDYVPKGIACRAKRHSSSEEQVTKQAGDVFGSGKEKNERIGTHWVGCGMEGGHRHYECLQREYRELSAQSATAPQKWMACRAPSTICTITSAGGWYCHSCGASELEPECRYLRSVSSGREREGKE